MKTRIQFEQGAFMSLCLPCLAAMLVLSACMKKKCVTCTTAYPVPEQDTFSHRHESHYYCDITVEKEKHLEESGTRDTVILVNGKEYVTLIRTDCQ